MGSSMRLRSTFGFCLLFAITLALVLVGLSYQNYVDVQISFGNSLFSNKSRTVQFKQKKLSPLSDFDKLLEESKEVTFYFPLSQVKSTQIYGYYKELFLNSGLIEFISIENSRTPQAVVGKRYLQKKEAGEYQKIKILNKEYRIEGVLSPNVSGILDVLAFVCLDQDDALHTSKLVVDGSSEKEIEKVVHQLKENYDIDILKEEENVIEKTMYGDENTSNFRKLLAGLLLLLFIMQLIYLSRQDCEEMKVQWLLGIKISHTLKILWKRIALQTLLSFFIVVVAYAVIYQIFLSKYYLSCYILELFLVASIFVLSAIFIQTIYFIVAIASMKRNGVK